MKRLLREGCHKVYIGQKMIGNDLRAVPDFLLAESGKNTVVIFSLNVRHQQLADTFLALPGKGWFADHRLYSRVPALA